MSPKDFELTKRNQLTAFQRQLVEIPQNTYVTLHLSSSERIHGYMNGSDDPRVVHLVYREKDTNRHIGCVAVATSEVVAFTVLMDLQDTNKEK